MAAKVASSVVAVSSDLIEAIRAFGVHKQVEHCGQDLTVSPFDFYATCPRCGKKMKLRGMSALPEVVDVVDAVLEWLNQPGAEAIASQRRADLQADSETDN